MSGLLWIGICGLFPAPPAVIVTVESLSGPPRTGTVAEWTTERIALDADGERVAIALRDVLSVAAPPAGSSEPAPTRAWVEFVDGTYLEASAYTVKAGVASMQLGARALAVDTRNIRSVRLQRPTPELDNAWREIVTAGGRADIAVLRRSKTSLDQLEGVFHDISEDAIEFEFDEQRIAVKHAKLEGIVYFHPPQEIAKAVGTLQETGGSQWRVRTLELAGSVLKLATPCGVQAEVPLEQFVRLDCAAGNVAYLSDLEFELAECTPFIATQLPAKRILQLYEPRRNESFAGSGLWLGAGNQIQRYEKGLAVHSRSLLIFRLPESFRRLTAVAGIDSRLHGAGNVLLVVRGDGRELLRLPISGQQPPVELDLNVEGVRRLEILVDFGDTMDVADHLNLGNARVIK